jgi:hypothetical protein
VGLITVEMGSPERVGRHRFRAALFGGDGQGAPED